MLQFCEMDGISNKQVNRHYETCSSQRVSDLLLLVSYLWCHIWDMSPGLHVWAVFSSKMYFEWTALHPSVSSHLGPADGLYRN